MGLLSGRAVTRPEARRLETEQTCRWNVPRLDAKYAACRKLLSDDRKDASPASGVQQEGAFYSVKYLVGLQKLFDIARVEQNKLSIVRQRGTPLSGESNRS
ncbi:hypothetical protein GCM10007874_32550 [Labrys miyagiensis]|uniref:Uncharacterized protein n=1 Tax=Labrys miyagiensis TaxID=346912 RepID=A0ABQ6CIP9_9HYPH|nr:hypothetical protein GCM10007874_32550 [Labrys miyagiensis]